MADLEREGLDRIQGAQQRETALPVPRVLEDPTEHIETTESDPAAVAPTREATTDKSVTLRNLFQHRDAHPCVLDLVLLKKYGPDWLAWEVESLIMAVGHDFGNISDLNMGKLHAVKALHLVDFFWQQWEVFTPCLMAFNDLLPEFAVMHVPTVAQCAVAVDVANHIRTDVDWSDEMKLYLATVFRHDGIFVPREPLNFVQVDVLGLPLDRDEISRRWTQVHASRKPPTDNTVEGEQLRRMLIADTYLEEFRARLHRQFHIADHV